MIRRRAWLATAALVLGSVSGAVPATAQDSEEPLLDDLPARSITVGAVLAGELQLDDQNGNRINRQDYDPAPYGSVRLMGRF